MNNTPTASLTVDFPRMANRDERLHSVGRNGYFVTSGLHISPQPKHVLLRPINSRGAIGKCSVELPNDPKVLRAIATALADRAFELENQA